MSSVTVLRSFGMTPSLLRFCVALAPFVSCNLVAPASPQPTAAGQRRAVFTVEAARVAAPDLDGARAPFDVPYRNSRDSEPQYLASAVPAPATGVETSTAVVHPWRRLLKREVTPAVVAKANAIIAKHSTIGEEVPFAVAGERFLARIEEHYHPPGGDKFPWGPHPGVSVFVARPKPAR